MVHAARRRQRDLSNGFRKINDQRGHAVGDRLLQLVAARLRNALRHDDVFVRHGGDEFVALVSLRHAGDAKFVAEKLRRVLRHEPFALDQLTLHVSASVGAAIAGSSGTVIDDLIRTADEAMYREKRKHHRSTNQPVAPAFEIESRA